MIDLTEYFLSAASKAVQWSPSKMFQFLDKLTSKIPNAKADWQINELYSWSQLAGIKVEWELLPFEQRTWLMVKKENVAIGYIRVDMPLLIMLENYVSDLENEIISNEIVLVSVKDFNLNKFSIDLENEKRLHPEKRKGKFWNLSKDIVDPNHFSINELWWATIAPPSLKAKQNLTSDILKAFSKKENWGLQKFEFALNLISENISYSRISWDKDSGEKWGEIRSDDETICFIGADIPLFFVCAKYTKTIYSLVSQNNPNLILVTMNSSKTLEFELDKKDVCNLLPRWKLESLAQPFSIEDLIVTTI